MSLVAGCTLCKEHCGCSLPSPPIASQPAPAHVNPTAAVIPVTAIPVTVVPVTVVPVTVQPINVTIPLIGYVSVPVAVLGRVVWVDVPVAVPVDVTTNVIVPTPAAPAVPIVPTPAVPAPVVPTPVVPTPAVPTPVVPAPAVPVVPAPAVRRNRPKHKMSAEYNRGYKTGVTDGKKRQIQIFFDASKEFNDGYADGHDSCHPYSNEYDDTEPLGWRHGGDV